MNILVCTHIYLFGTFFSLNSVIKINLTNMVIVTIRLSNKSRQMPRCFSATYTDCRFVGLGFKSRVGPNIVAGLLYQEIVSNSPDFGSWQYHTLSPRRHVKCRFCAWSLTCRVELSSHRLRVKRIKSELNITVNSILQRTSFHILHDAFTGSIWLVQRA